MTKRDALLTVLGALLVGCAAEATTPATDEVVDAQPQRPAQPEAVITEAVTRQPLLAWSFEPASADCNGWPVEGGQTIRAYPPHSGAYSCMVCATGEAPTVQLTRALGAVPAGRYKLTAWVRSRVQNAAPREAVAMLDADTEDGPRLVSAPTVAVRDAWDVLETTIDLRAGARDLRVAIGAVAAEADHCLFVDDVSVTTDE